MRTAANVADDDALDEWAQYGWWHRGSIGLV
jgi:hypothetical protein